MFKADLHIHTHYSMDCSTKLEEIIRACERKNINCIAIADHGAVEGAFKLKELAPFYVIVAEEILTTRGEIMGMFLKERIPSGLSIEESIRRIKDQGALLCAQHPFDRIRPDSLKAEVMDEIADQIDLVEVFNARSLFPGIQSRAQKLAEKFNKVISAGSDAHIVAEVGNYFVEMKEFTGKKEFLESLSTGKIQGHKSNPFVHITSKHNKFLKKLTR